MRLQPAYKLSIDDAFEKDVDDALGLADCLRLRGIKAIILADDVYEATLGSSRDCERPAGAVLGSQAGERELMEEILSAVATLAIGGRSLLAPRGCRGRDCS